MSVAIRVRQLGKRYRIRHETRARYETLRDLLARGLSLRGRGREAEVEEFWALRDVDFEIKQGERVGIIGRNGAGKSTLLKLLSRITEPTTGSIRIRGRVSSLLEVGTGFHPELTGRENIFLNGAILGMRRAEIQRRFDEIVAFAEVERFLDTPVKRYSSGMYVRLAFAVAAHLEPELLFVDEVLAVGDVAFQRKCLGKMKDVAETGRTVVFVSHNLHSIRELCPRCIMLGAGEITEDGDSAGVVEKYVGRAKGKAEIDLTQVEQTGAKAYSRLIRLSLFNSKGTLATCFEMGESLTARIQFEITREAKDVEVGLKVSTQFGAAIHYFNSTWEGQSLDLCPGTHSIEVNVPEVLLLPGTYNLGLWILKGNEWSDALAQDITSITVSKGSVPVNPMRIEQYAVSGGEVYARSHWKLR